MKIVQMIEILRKQLHDIGIAIEVFENLAERRIEERITTEVVDSAAGPHKHSGKTNSFSARVERPLPPTVPHLTPLRRLAAVREALGQSGAAGGSLLDGV